MIIEVQRLHVGLRSLSGMCLRAFGVNKPVAPAEHPQKRHLMPAGRVGGEAVGVP